MSFPYTLIDLTHSLHPKIPSWEMGCGFHQKIVLDYADSQHRSDTQFRVMHLDMPAGIGTHMDAPSHCFPGAKNIDEFKLNQLCLPCIVIDVSTQAAQAGEFFTLAVSHILAFEKTHETIPAESCVMINTGWSRHWDDAEKYHNQHIFPSISAEAAMYLLEKNISALGVDTLSPDRPDQGYPVHQCLLGAGKIILENVANLNLLAPTGSQVIIAPLKIQQGTEAPVRLIGMVLK